jgi:hypothetical protein
MDITREAGLWERIAISLKLIPGIRRKYVYGITICVSGMDAPIDSTFFHIGDVYSVIEFPGGCWLIVAVVTPSTGNRVRLGCATGETYRDIRESDLLGARIVSIGQAYIENKTSLMKGLTLEDGTYRNPDSCDTEAPNPAVSPNNGENGFQ